MKAKIYTLPIMITVNDNDIKGIISDILSAIDRYFDDNDNSWQYIDEEAKENFIKQVLHDIYPELINSLLDNLPNP